MQHHNRLAHILLTAAVLATANFGLAQAADTAELESKFAAADTNHDGKLTLAEAQAGMPRVAKNFSRIDKDGKGFLTLDQLKAAAK